MKLDGNSVVDVIPLASVILLVFPNVAPVVVQVTVWLGSGLPLASVTFTMVSWNWTLLAPKHPGQITWPLPDTTETVCAEAAVTPNRQANAAKIMINRFCFKN